METRIDQLEPLSPEWAEAFRHAHEAFSIRDVAQLYGLTYPTAKAEIERLVREGYVKELIRLGRSPRSIRYVWIGPDRLPAE
jgi:DNA-binding MarR family transcriptional regulator